jgi:hypothetical protein
MKAAPLLIAAALLITFTHPARGQGALRFPEPAAPAPRVVEERGPSPMYYRLPPDTLLGSFRIGLGANSRLAIGGEEAGWAFAFDALAGAVVRPSRASRLGLWAEGGYHYVGFSEHLASLGVGPILHRIGSGSDYRPHEPGRVTLALLPRGLAGSLRGEAAAGVRTGLLAGYWFYALEIAHQVLIAGPRRVHEVHLVFTAPAFFGEEDN